MRQMAGSRFWMITVLALFLIPYPTTAQSLRHITGEVFTINNKNENTPIEGATVLAPGVLAGAQTDQSGSFEIDVPDTSRFLLISFVGYLTDTLMINESQLHYLVELVQPHKLKEVQVIQKLKTTEIGLITTIKTEKIGQAELFKAACCNLSQSFETTPSIDVSFTDAVTGYRTIRLLGLAGPYTLITRENIPDVRGLASVAGLTFTPGAWMEGMQLSKGTGSVVNGFESLAGQLNVELQKPFAGEKWYVNVYQGSQGNSEASVNYRNSINANLGTMVMADVTSQWLKVDLNRDHFIDLPLGQSFNILNRWIYTSPSDWMIQGGVKAYYTHGVGGDWSYKEGDPQTEGHPWGYIGTTRRIEDWAKIAKVSKARDESSVGLQLSNTNHDQNSMYGTNNYSGLQNSFYANLIYQTYIGNTKHIIKFGASELLDVFNETLIQAKVQHYYNRNESVPGVYAEYSWSYSDNFNMIAGLRGDYDNYYGGFITPRLHLRYAPWKRTAIRASIGRAERTANIFADNIGYFASNRQVDILNPVAGKPYGLTAEVAWNTGINITHKFKYRYHEGVFTVDYYYTQFQSQVVVDVNYPQVLSFYNQTGLSFAHSFQAQFDYELFRRFNVRLAYRYYDVMVSYYELGLKEKPFVPANREFINMAYSTTNNWKFDYTINWVGRERTPYAEHDHGGSGTGVSAYSPAFYQMNCQVTKVFSSKFELYMGGENLTNFMQHDAIVNYGNPYSRLFDASQIWGPMMGLNIYVGARYRFN